MNMNMKNEDEQEQDMGVCMFGGYWEREVKRKGRFGGGGDCGVAHLSGLCASINCKFCFLLFSMFSPFSLLPSFLLDSLFPFAGQFNHFSIIIYCL